MDKLNENIITLYNKWKSGYVRKETDLEEKIKPMREWVEKHFPEECYDNFSYYKDGIIYNGDFNMPDSSLIDGELPYPFIEITGYFSIYYSSIKSFKNFPSIVGGDFLCEHCDLLTSLDGLPSKINGDIKIGYCPQITSIEKGILPKKVNGALGIYNCISLTSLENCVEEVEFDFDCSGCKKLTSLEGAPKKVGGDFKCNYCYDILTLNGAPDVIDGDFKCSCCSSLTNLEGAPRVVKHHFICASCKSLVSLEGAPEELHGFSSYNCIALTSLKGLPSVIEGDVNLAKCLSLKNLKGITNITGDLTVDRNFTQNKRRGLKVDGIIYYYN